MRRMRRMKILEDGRLGGSGLRPRRAGVVRGRAREIVVVVVVEVVVEIVV
jgi:hypothetical protein